MISKNVLHYPALRDPEQRDKIIEELPTFVGTGLRRHLALRRRPRLRKQL